MNKPSKPNRPLPREIKEYKNWHCCTLQIARDDLLKQYERDYKTYLLELCKDPESNLEEILTGIIELT